MSSGRSDSSEIVDAMVLAARNAAVSKQFKLATLPRLADLIGRPESEAQLQARFHWVEGRCGIDGSVSATLRTTCQRCLQAVELPIEDEFHVVLAKSEEELDEISEEQDSLIADATHLDLSWLAEEQLLLAMPLVPLHADANCGAHVARRVEAQSEAGSTVELPVEDKQIPFAHLRELMKK